MYISNDALLIAGAILIVGVAIAYLWLSTRDKELNKKKRR